MQQSQIKRRSKISLDCFLSRIITLAKFLKKEEKNSKTSLEFKVNIRNYCDYKIHKLYKEYKNSCQNERNIV